MNPVTTKLRMCLCIAFGLLCLAASGHADEADAVQPDLFRERREGISLSLENDLFGGGSDPTDRWFSNGFHASTGYDSGKGSFWGRPLVDLGRWLLLPGEACPADADTGSGLHAATGRANPCNLALNLEFGQNIYTPRHIEDPDPQVRDRPWAGWLYGGVGLSHASGSRHQAWSLKLGPTGPASLAKEIQTGVHRYLTDSPKPRGWRYQLRPRLGVQLGYLSTHRYPLFDTFGVQASWGASVGNLRTMARAGLGLTWSPNREALTWFQPGVTDEGEFLVPDFDARPLDGSLLDTLRHIVLFAHVQAAAVGYNAFIEGRTYGPRNDVKPVWDVLTTTLGFSVPFGDRGRYKLGFAWKRRSPEFSVRGEIGRDFYQRWGVVSLSYDFDLGEAPRRAAP